MDGADLKAQFFSGFAQRGLNSRLIGLDMTPWKRYLSRHTVYTTGCFRRLPCLVVLGRLC